MVSTNRRRIVAGIAVVSLAMVLLLAGVGGAADVTTQPQFVDTNVTSDTTWSPNEGPYRITTDIAVTEGATLSIEPGTTIEFVDGASLQVRGKLDAGDAGEEVVLESFRDDEAASAGAWAGLVVSGELVLTDARVTDATTGLRTEPGGRLTATDLVVDRMGADGVAVGDGSQVTLRNASFGRIEQRDIRLGTEADDQAADADEQPAGLALHSSTLPHGIEGGLDGAGMTTVTVAESTITGPVDIGVNAVRIDDSTIDTRFEVRSEVYRAVQSVSLVGSTVPADGELVVESEEGLSGAVERNRIAGHVRLVEPAGVTVRENEVDSGRISLGGYSVTDVQVVENRITNGSIHLAASNSISQATVEDNRAYGGKTPLLLTAKFVSETQVVGNGVYGAEGTGISLRPPRTGEAGELTLRDNTVVESGTGIRIAFGGSRSLYNPGQNSTVRGNLLAVNDRGLVVYNDLSARITENRIVDNEVGVRLDSTGVNEEQVYVVNGNDLSGNEVGLAYLGPAELAVTAERNYWGAESGPEYPAVVPNGEGARVSTDGPTVDVIPFVGAPPEGLPTALPTPSATVKVAGDGTVTVTPSGVDSKTRYVISFGDGTWTTVRSSAAKHTYQGTANHTVAVYAIDANGRASVPPVRKSVATPTPTPTRTPERTGRDENGPTASPTATPGSPDHTTSSGQAGFGILVAVFTLLGGRVAYRS